ncbi:sulfite reductase subunit alpha [Sinirhodobacter populi]|uniref:assimilatory sulfite reductase (NADPH) n=1 Tax=Paenirhodobacter populi TaxID=2306993 RepID=A0A443IL41_9RHOB|nr:sulfite reductase subunit alpha [Sinirhodobacter populi]RWR05404.1 sulfite reductase subunit alpha [Sinirhodobacter populi]RWR27652.1 sulfite reductase subunit alpha [Sinirhodobacter populi]
MRIPFIPEDAPFSGDQRAWLAGFLAGLHSRHAIGATATAPAAEAKPAQVMNVLFGSQTGNAEAMAEAAAKSARAMGFDARLAALDDVTMAELAAMSRVVIVCSTYGEGEMPDNAQLFWEALSGSDAPRLEHLQFAVLALGDTGYDGFCQAGKLIDVRLEQLGAHRLAARQDCDVDYEEPAGAWVGTVLPLLSGTSGPVPAPTPAKTGWSRKNPYAAKLTCNRRLSGEGSAKEIRHYEFDLGESGLIYEAGDALGVMPRNDPELAARILAMIGATQETPGPDGRPLLEALIDSHEIVTPSRELIQRVEARARNEELSHVLKNGDREALDAWLWGRDTLDLLQLMPTGTLEAQDFTALLKPLQHRAYSISSSPKAHPGSVHLTVASVRYEGNGRAHGGVCSTFLADRAEEMAGIFVSQNKSFRVPADDDAPLIMVGPGTGIAPFRAFLQERRARGAKGRNWLFFGDQHRATDFIYDTELSEMSHSGLLTRLDLAFSRDQAEKVYVQTRMRENGKALYGWLQEGGHFHVCGDATRMARDVDAALHEIIATQGGMSAEAATVYVNGLKREKRYLRDVY